MIYDDDDPHADMYDVDDGGIDTYGSASVLS